MVLTAAFVVVRSSQNCIILQRSHYYQATVGLNVAVNPVQLLSARVSVQTITEHHPRCEGRRIISNTDVGGLHHRYERRIKVSSALRRDSIRIGLYPCAALLRAPVDALVKRGKRPLSADDAGRVTPEAALPQIPCIPPDYTSR